MVKQGDNIFPMCFNLFINDLLKELNTCNVGVMVNDWLICALAYADDIVLLTKKVNNM